MIITIDGPVASGKSTIARRLAKKLKMYYLGTGSLYRGLAYVLIHHASYLEEDLENPKPEDLKTYLDPKRFVYVYDHEHGEKITFDGQDITPFLKKGASMDKAASVLSAKKVVREALLELQRFYGKNYDLVVEGRDVGSVVFPDADYRFFLTASLQIRAQRWQSDQQKKGVEVAIEDAMKIVSARDKRDQERKVAPLIKPSGATLIDNSDLDLEETLKEFMRFIWPS